jgi:hypothetical protein
VSRAARAARGSASGGTARAARGVNEGKLRRTSTLAWPRGCAIAHAARRSWCAVGGAAAGDASLKAARRRCVAKTSLLRRHQASA